MKLRHLTLLSVLFLATLPRVCAAAPLESAEDNAGVVINQTDELIYPPMMLYTAVYSGDVHAVISLDADGVLTDSLVVAYTNVAFADAALAALKRWSYVPARVHGRPSAARVDVVFEFRNKGVVVSSLPGGLEKLFFHATFDERYVYKACKLRDIDRIPLPLEVVQPKLPEGGLPAGTKRIVTVEFYIDEQGRVRMPAIGRVDAEDPYAVASVAAVEKWRFEPPLRNGRPVLVLAKQEFTFVPKP